MTADKESYWTAVANVVQERRYGPDGIETRYASRHFAPGAKVYIIDAFGGMCERVVIVGLHRKTKRMIKLVFAVELLENFKAKVCYVPAVIEKIKEHFSTLDITRLNKTFAETLCEVLPIWKAEALKNKKFPL